MTDSVDRLISQATDTLRARFPEGTGPFHFGIAPGRVELLGNHTDYNGGLVMSAAIDRFTAVVGRPSSERTLRISSLNLDATDRFPLDLLIPNSPSSWLNYIKGVLWAIQNAVGVPLETGFDAVIVGDVPVGAGLSSSASLQASLAMFLFQAGLVPQLSIQVEEGDASDRSRMALAKILQRSENEFVGVASGLLDQFSVLMGRANHALQLDCRDLSFQRLPLGQPPPAIVICDSKTSRQLADGMYNRRRAECETVVTYFQSIRGQDPVRWLRDISLSELTEHWDRLDPIGRLRARHILTENTRVERGSAALLAGDLAEFGRLMTESHASSRDDFDNSSDELNSLIEAAQSAPGFLGGKLSGAGWAGCAVNLVNPDAADRFSETVRTAYARKTGVIPDIHVCKAATGATGHSLSKTMNTSPRDKQP